MSDDLDENIMTAAKSTMLLMQPMSAMSLNLLDYCLQLSRKHKIKLAFIFPVGHLGFLTTNTNTFISSKNTHKQSAHTNWYKKYIAFKSK